MEVDDARPLRETRVCVSARANHGRLGAAKILTVHSITRALRLAPRGELGAPLRIEHELHWELLVSVELASNN